MVQRSDLYVTRVWRKTTTGKAEFNELAGGRHYVYAPKTVVSNLSALTTVISPRASWRPIFFVAYI